MHMARCKFDALNLLVEDGGSNLLHWWRRPESKTSGDAAWARFRGEEARFDTRGCRVPGRVVCDVVEPALARALVLAAEALRWDVVVQIATELRARLLPVCARGHYASGCLRVQMLEAGG